MTERYVRPALTAREPAPQWRAAARFRVAAAVALVFAAYLLFLVFHNVVSTAGEQDPGVAFCGRSGTVQSSGTHRHADVPPVLRCSKVSFPAS